MLLSRSGDFNLLLHIIGVRRLDFPMRENPVCGMCLDRHPAHWESGQEKIGHAGIPTTYSTTPWAQSATNFNVFRFWHGSVISCGIFYSCFVAEKEVSPGVFHLSLACFTFVYTFLKFYFLLCIFLFHLLLLILSFLRVWWRKWVPRYLIFPLLVSHFCIGFWSLFLVMHFLLLFSFNVIVLKGKITGLDYERESKAGYIISFKGVVWFIFTV